MRLNDAASGTGRSLNKEIVDRLGAELRSRSRGGTGRGQTRGSHADFQGEADGTRPRGDRRGARGGAAPGSSPRAARTRRHRSPASRSSSPARSSQRSSQGGSRTAAAAASPPSCFAAQQQLDNARTAPGDRRPGRATRPPSRACRASARRGGTWNERHARPLRRRRSGLPRLLLELERRLRARHRPHHRPRGRQGRRRLRRRRRRRRLALDDRRRQLDADRRQPAVALLGRPRARRRPARSGTRTGEANTGGTTLRRHRRLPPREPGDAARSRRRPRRRQRARVHDDQPLRFAGDTVWAATLRGVYSHSVSGPAATPWKLRFAPNPAYLPGGANAGAQNAGYKNIVNDLAVDPKNAKHMIAARGLARRRRLQRLLRVDGRGTTWTKINPTGGLDADGHRLRDLRVLGRRQQALRDQPVAEAANKLTGTKAATRCSTASTCRTTATRPARGTRSPTSTKLGRTRARRSSSRSAARATARACRPGTTSSSRSTRRTPNHVLRGPRGGLRDAERRLELDDDRPVLELLLLLLGPDSLYPPNGNRSAARSRRTPTSTRSRSARSAARRTSSSATTAASTAGPLNGTVNRTATATDWKSLNDGTIDALQYYYVGVGKLNADDAARPDLEHRRRPGARQRRPAGQRRLAAPAGRPEDGLELRRRRRRRPRRPGRRLQHRPGVRLPVDAGDARRAPTRARVIRTRSSTSRRCDDVRHLAAGRQRAVHRAVHGERQEHQPVARRRHQPLVPGQGLRASRPARSGRRSTRCRRPARRSPRSRTRATARSRPGAARARTAARRSRAARSSARSPAARGRSSRSTCRGRLPEPLPPGRGDRPEGRERPDRRRQRVLAPLHRGPGRGHRPRLRVEGRRR